MAPPVTRWLRSFASALVGVARWLGHRLAALPSPLVWIDGTIDAAPKVFDDTMPAHWIDRLPILALVAAGLLSLPLLIRSSGTLSNLPVAGTSSVGSNAVVDMDGFTDDFDRGELNAALWIPHHLPHWSDRESSRARYRFTDRSVVLFVADDQQPWCPEFDGNVRVSALQSGCFAGPLGSPIGQHRFNEHVVVREEQPTQRLGLCHHGSIELRCRADLTPTALASLYLIGFEESPDESGEITVMEVFGHGVADGSAQLGRGVKAINDPRLVDEFTDDPVTIDVADWHTYRIDWHHDGIDFFCDDQPIHATEQTPDYPMQIMLTLYELPTDDDTITTPTWATFEIDQITYHPLRQAERTP